VTQLDRCLSLMEDDGIDVLLLGREANARAVAGTNRLWLAGTRAFAPSCVVVRSSGAVHVLANTDDAVPTGFPVDRLFGITWNPAHLAAALSSISGLAGARRVATDGMTPLMFQMLSSVMADASFVDAGPLIAQLWLEPSAERVEGVRTAAAVARAGLDAMAQALRPGTRARMLRGACAATFAELGVTTPAFEAVAAPLEGGGSTWLPPERFFGEGEPVVLRAGALRDGWEASVARSYVVGEPSGEADDPAGWDEVRARCTSGVTIGELRADGAIAYGVGGGVEPWEDDVALQPGMVIALELQHGTRLRQDVLLVDDGPPELLTA
jgi:Xaa-Pro aminopeptidase